MLGVGNIAQSVDYMFLKIIMVAVKTRARDQFYKETARELITNFGQLTNPSLDLTLQIKMPARNIKHLSPSKGIGFKDRYLGQDQP